MLNAPAAALRRVCCVLTMLVFASMGIGLPMLDAVRFHGRGEHLNGQTHYDPAGGCQDHAENCLLVLTIGVDRAILPSAFTSRLAPPAPQVSAPIADPAVSQVFLLQSRTRAPPSPLA